MAGRRRRTYAHAVMLPTVPDLGLLLVRTDYSDDRAWHAALLAATAVYHKDDFERTGALLWPTMRDQTVLFVDFNELKRLRCTDLPRPIRYWPSRHVLCNTQPSDCSTGRMNAWSRYLARPPIPYAEDW